MRTLLIVYDNGSHIPFFPQGIAYLAGSLDKAGHHVDIWRQDISHEPESELTAILDEGWLGSISIEDHKKGQGFDVVGLGFNAGYYQFAKCLKIAQAVNKSKNRSKFKFVLGGHGPAAAPEYFLNKFEADIIVKGDGEDAIVAIADNLATDKIMNCAPDPDVDTFLWPAYSMFPIDVYRLIRWPTSTETDFCMPILSGRGCPYKCTFCYRMDEGDFRPRSPEAVIEEMQFLNRDCGINHFQFSDELFMSSRSRVEDFCYVLGTHPEARKIKNLKWDCNGRLNFADKETLKCMKDTGCEYINYGIEALGDQVLKNIKKGLTVAQIEKGVKETLNAGITPGLNIMWGNPGDDAKTLEKGVNFLLEYDTCRELRTIRPMTPYPGSQAFKDSGLTAKEFYEEKHINSDLLTVNLTDMSDEEVHRHLREANGLLYNNYLDKKLSSFIDQTRELYTNLNPNFRGFRAI